MTKLTNIYFPTGEIEKMLVNSIWKLSELDMNERKELILPKGTVEIIFNFSDIINYQNPSLGISTQLPLVLVNGINFKPFKLTKTGNQEFLGIQLNSIGLKSIFNISVHEINNRVFNGKDICPDLGILSEKLYYCKTFSQQVEVLLTWIKNKLFVTKNTYSLYRANKLLSFNKPKNLTVKNISEQLFISDRQLRRFSIEWLGMNTEEFILYNKYLNSLHQIHNSKKSLTEIGIESGYYDQSHFIREFKSYTNMTPKQYRDANAEYIGHIKIY